MPARVDADADDGVLSFGAACPSLNRVVLRCCGGGGLVLVGGGSREGRPLGLTSPTVDLRGFKLDVDRLMGMAAAAPPAAPPLCPRCGTVQLLPPSPVNSRFEGRWSASAWTPKSLTRLGLRLTVRLTGDEGDLSIADGSYALRGPAWTIFEGEVVGCTGAVPRPFCSLCGLSGSCSAVLSLALGKASRVGCLRAFSAPGLRLSAVDVDERRMAPFEGLFVVVIVLVVVEGLSGLPR